MLFRSLMVCDVPDDPAGRRKFREIVQTMRPALPGDCEIRDFKMVEDGTGRVIDKWDPV